MDVRSHFQEDIEMTREQMPSILLCTGHSLKIPDIVESRDVYVWDKQGKQYMDLESGVLPFESILL